MTDKRKMNHIYKIKKTQKNKERPNDRKEQQQIEQT